MKLLTTVALATKLSEIRGATFATLICETDARLKKTGNPFGQVQKVSRVNVCLGFQYEAAVNRQRTREGAEADFESAPRQWGSRIPGTFLVEHKGRTYLETKVERSLEHAYITADGRELPINITTFAEMEVEDGLALREAINGISTNSKKA